MAKSNINIKPSKRGSLRAAMHAKKGEKLSVAEMQRKKKNASPAMKKKLTFAINARRWKHPDGGEVKGPILTVNNNLWTPQTRSSIYPYLAQSGALGMGVDSLTYDQWNKLSPEETLKYMDRSKGFDYTIGNTANPGGIKYWNMKEVPNVQAKYNMSTNHYWNSKKNTEYPIGGIVSGAGGVLGTIPTPWTKIAGAALSFGGQLIGGIEENKAAEEKAQLESQNAARMANIRIGNPYSAVFAYGGLAPNGTPIEVEDDEVMRNPQDGSMVEFNGPTHSEGGININAEPGSQIFGNLKIKSGQYTGMEYKEAANLIRQKIARLQNKLNK